MFKPITLSKKLQKSNTNKVIILHVNPQRKIRWIKKFLLEILNADYDVHNIILSKVWIY